MTTYELEKYANTFLQENFDMSLNIPITINGRLTKTMGCLVLSRIGFTEMKPKEIQIATRTLNSPRDFVLDVLRHELVHYALVRLGKPYMDGHPYFENTLKRLGISSTNTTSSRAYNKNHVYSCKCENDHKRARRISGTAKTKVGQAIPYNCAECKSTLIYKGQF